MDDEKSLYWWILILRNQLAFPLNSILNRVFASVSKFFSLSASPTLGLEILVLRFIAMFLLVLAIFCLELVKLPLSPEISLSCTGTAVTLARTF